MLKNIMKVFIFVALLFGFGTQVRATVQEKEEPTVVIDKYVGEEIEEGLYEITLKVQGYWIYEEEDEKTPYDVMLVLDRSGSMSGNKMATLIDQAQTFVANFLSLHEDNRIAIVSFAGSKDYPTGYWTNESNGFSKDVNFLKGKIENLEANGGTHLEGGIHQGHQIMEADTGPNKKVMIVMADGQPTYGFGWAKTRYNFDYNTIIGSGNQGYYKIGTTTYYHRDSVKYIADQVKENYDVYAIGYGISSDNAAKQVLQDVAMDNAYYDADVTNLQSIFGQITNTIVDRYPMGLNAIVTDEIADEFTFVEFTYIEPGTTATEENNIITWEVGDLDDTLYTLKYTIRIEEGLKDGFYNTNKKAILEYDDGEEEFPIPSVEVKNPKEPEEPSEDPGDNGNDDETPPSNGDDEKPIEEDPTPTPDPTPEPTPEPEPEQLIPEMGDSGLVKFGVVGVALGALLLILSKKEN